MTISCGHLALAQIFHGRTNYDAVHNSDLDLQRRRSHGSSSLSSAMQRIRIVRTQDRLACEAEL